MDANDKNEIITIIEPTKSWFGSDWRKVWEYRDLVWMFAKRDLFVVYRQTILGPVWFLIQPIIMAIVFTVIFGRVAKINTGGVPHIVFFMSGTVLWSFYSAIVNYSAQSLFSNAPLFSKVWFPRLILPISAVLTNLAHLALGVLIFLAFYANEIRQGAALAPNLWLLAMPLIILHLICLGIGVGMCVAAATVKYRDLRFALPFIMQMWMYATPIVYPSSGVVDPVFRAIMLANPVAPAIEVFRHSFTGSGTIEPLNIAVSLAMTALLFLAGTALFNRAQRTYLDIV